MLARIDVLVSEVAWTGWPKLKLALFRWMQERGAESDSIAVAAFPEGSESTVVRVSRISESEQTLDWVEWLAPHHFFGAAQWALDHFANIQMRLAIDSLKRREVPQQAVPETDHDHDQAQGINSMAPAKPAAPTRSAPKKSAPKKSAPAARKAEPAPTRAAPKKAAPKVPVPAAKPAATASKRTAPKKSAPAAKPAAKPKPR